MNRTSSGSTGDHDVLNIALAKQAKLAYVEYTSSKTFDPRPSSLDDMGNVLLDLSLSALSDKS